VFLFVLSARPCYYLSPVNRRSSLAALLSFLFFSIKVSKGGAPSSSSDGRIISTGLPYNKFLSTYKNSVQTYESL